MTRRNAGKHRLQAQNFKVQMLSLRDCLVTGSCTFFYQIILGEEENVATYFQEQMEGPFVQVTASQKAVKNTVKPSFIQQTKNTFYNSYTSNNNNNKQLKLRAHF